MEAEDGGPTRSLSSDPISLYVSLDSPKAPSRPCAREAPIKKPTATHSTATREGTSPAVIALTKDPIVCTSLRNVQENPSEWAGRMAGEYCHKTGN